MVDAISPRAQRLREAGHKLTNARLTVLRVLETSESHMNSAAILEAVNRLDPEIGRASVFRTLELFTRLGIVRPTYIESSSTPNYVLLPNGHHHHIICVNCHRVIEFDECALGPLVGELEQRHNVRLIGHLLELYGLCERCR
ncbi:MAG: Fur family transcriptional regulator [Aggregatilineales bacterium]